jgi:putative SOS response-associated peptidase YedK
MCGRFTLTQSRYELEDFFGVETENDHVDDHVYVPHFNFPPTEQVPGAHFGKDGEMRLDTYRWGFVPNWVRNIAEFKLTTINARAESVAKAKTYAAAFRRHRLLVAADSFFEWDRTDQKNKQPYVFARRDGEPMAFAGLYDSYLHPDTSEGERWVATCTILTTAANDDMPIHDRLPLILEKDVWERWLDPDLQDVDELEGMIGVASAGVLRHYPVDRKVGSVKNDDASCIEPIELGAGTLF